MKHIELSQGKKAIVDDAQYEFLVQWKWSYSEGYAMRRKNKKPNGKNIKMHRVIIGAPDGKLVDHINGNTLDNRKENLRLCDARQNTINRKPRGKSKYKGVYYRKDCKKWAAGMKIKGKPLHLGIFDKEKDAARAYNKEAKKRYGAFAVLNEC